jgi:hypothetical protein
LVTYAGSLAIDFTNRDWGIETSDVPADAGENARKATTLGFSFALPPYFVGMWSLVLGSVACSATPWVSLKRFSLRTLLIATTAVAVVLGVVVWAASA